MYPDEAQAESRLVSFCLLFEPRLVVDNSCFLA